MNLSNTFKNLLLIACVLGLTAGCFGSSSADPDLPNVDRATGTHYKDELVATLDNGCQYRRITVQAAGERWINVHRVFICPVSMVVTNNPGVKGRSEDIAVIPAVLPDPALVAREAALRKLSDDDRKVLGLDK